MDNSDYIEIGKFVFAKKHIVYAGAGSIGRRIKVQTIYGLPTYISFPTREECLAAYSKFANELCGNGDMEIDYSKTVMDSACSYKAVDLGLSSGLLWADRNIGASEPEEYGRYFAWGDTVGSRQDTSDWHLFDWDNCPWGESTPPMSTLDAEHDAATVNMGADWRMPDIADFKELLDNCTTKWTTQNGITGMLFTSKHNGNTLFFPAGGYRNGSSLEDAVDVGSYWSRSLYTSFSDYAHYLYFYCSNCYAYNYYRCSGRLVRGVRFR